MAIQMVAPPTLLPLQAPAPPSDVISKVSLYVGDLDPKVTEADLVETFCQMGRLFSVRLCRDKRSHQSLRYGYVNFVSPSDASKAFVCLNHKELKGKPMRIMWCQRDPIARKTGIGNLFVKNLDPSVTSARLQEIFCKFGSILSCKVAEEHGKSKGFGFVQFSSEESSIAALNALHDTTLEGKKLYVTKFVKKSERKGTHEEPKFTNLYVKNLDENVTEDVVRDKFSEFGKVCNVLIMKDAKGKSRGFGFVNFELHEAAKKAVEALNGAALLGSKKLFVGRAQKKAEREELLKREYREKINFHTEKPKVSNLYVKNLDTSIDDIKLEQCFSAFGKVSSAKVMRFDNGISKGFGFVSFSTPEEAKMALDTLHGKIFQGRSLYVAVAQSKEERSIALQSYYAQYPQRSFYTPTLDISTPQFHPAYYSFSPFPTLNPASCMSSYQPLPYQHFGRSEGSVYPSMSQSYQRNISTYVPTRQSQQEALMEWVYQHSMRYPNSNAATGAMKYETCKDQKISWNKRSKGAETFSKGSSIGNHKEKMGKLLRPLVENLQPVHAAKITGMPLEMNNSDVNKILNSPRSLEIYVEKAVRVLKDANSQTNADGCVASQPVKSACCY